MKDDLISRQAAIDALKSWDWQDVYPPILFEQLLEELPSAQPEREKGEWIPCSEKLPDLHKKPYWKEDGEEWYDSDDVLVCFKQGRGMEIAIGNICCEKNSNAYTWDHVYDCSDLEVDDMAIVAWMPLPEPYKEETE